MLKMKYFVLKPDGTDRYAVASRAALEAYENAIRSENVELAEDLRMWRARAFAEANPGSY